MSWNLAKKWKESNLGSLSFTKSATASPTKEKDARLGLAAADNAAPTSAKTAESPSQTPPATTPSATPAPAPAPAPTKPKAGILIVTLYEARDLSLPEQHRNVFTSQSPAKPHSVTSIAASLASVTLSSRIPDGDKSRQSQSSPGRGLKDIPLTHGAVAGNFMPYALVDFDNVQIFINSVQGSHDHPFWPGSSTQYKFDVSRRAELTVQLFVRNPNVKPGSGRTQDIPLGTVTITPRFETAPSSKVPLTGKNSQITSEYSGTQWLDLHDGTGKLQVGVEYRETRSTKLTVDDFELLKVVGRGSFGKVMQVRKKDTNRIYAIKTIRKAKIISRSEVTHTLAERSVLAQINNPFIVPLKFTFQSPEKLYFVLAYVNGGELFHYLSTQGRFDINRSRFYTAELLCALECLHGFNVIYRDLKPENILLDFQGHIALCDFGLCKLEMKDEDKTNTFCGTPEYLAPELLLGESYNKSIDWWTLGVLLYEMLTGLPPFYDEDTNEMYRKILTEPLHFPDHRIVPPAAKDLLTKLLNRDPAERLGARGAAEIKAHPFFHAIDWRKLLQRKYEPSFKPNVVDALDVSCSPIFNGDIPTDSPVDGPPISGTMQDQFTGFSYARSPVDLVGLGDSMKYPSVYMDTSSGRR